MRSLLLGLLATVLVMTACTDGTLGEDTAYRRLVDTYDSFDHCLATGNGSVCYQTLTLCSDGFARIDLENRPEDGSYTLENDSAVARFSRVTVVFDLDAARSSQLPGRHPWERVKPEFYDCMSSE